MDLLEIGKIVNTHGLRGEVKVIPWTDSAEDFENIKNVCIKDKSEYTHGLFPHLPIHFPLLPNLLLSIIYSIILPLF